MLIKVLYKCDQLVDRKERMIPLKNISSAWGASLLKCIREVIVRVFVGMTLLILMGCSQAVDDVPAAFSSEGNGEAYTGFRPEPGSYYTMKLDYKCSDSTQTPSIAHVKTVIEFKAQSDNAKVVDTCSGSQTEVFLGDLVLNELTPDIVGLGNEIAERQDAPPEPSTTKFAMVFCQGVNPDGTYIGRNYLIRQDSGSNYTLDIFTVGTPGVAANKIIQSVTNNTRGLEILTNYSGFDFLLVVNTTMVDENGKQSGSFNGVTLPGFQATDELKCIGLNSVQ